MSIWHEQAPDIEAMNRLGDNTLSALLGIEFAAIGDNWLSARMPVDHRTHQPFGRLHGGASVALAETIASVGAGFTIDHSLYVAVGMEINANHIRPVMQGWVTGTATAESIGRTTQIWTIRIADDADKLVCLSRITIAVIPIARA